MFASAGSFHVGSLASDPSAFTRAIAAAAKAFDIALRYGHVMKILDIGGGFSSGDILADGRIDIHDIPAAVNAALDQHFPEDRGVHIIAEPGR